MKKLFLILSFFVVTLLVGCSKTDNNSTNGVATTDSNDDVTVIKVATHDICGDDPRNENVGTEGCMSVEDSQVILGRLLAIEELYGYRFEFVEWQTEDHAEELINWNLGGSPDVDFVRLNGDEFNELALSGNLADISSQVNGMDTDGFFSSDITFKLGQIAGSYYGFSRDIMFYPEIFVYDNDILTNAGITKMPDEMWKDGEWNWDTAKTLFDTVQNSAGVDNPDLYAAVGAEAYYLFRHGIASNGVKFIDDQGKAQLNSVGVTDTFDWLESLVADDSLVLFTRPKTDDDTMNPYAKTDFISRWGAAQAAWEKGAPEDEYKTDDEKAVAFTLLDMWRSDCCIRNSGKDYSIVPFPTNSDDAYTPVSRGDMFAIPTGVSADRLDDIVKAMGYFTYVYNNGLEKSAEQYVNDWAQRNFPDQPLAGEILNHLQATAYSDYGVDYTQENWSYTQMTTDWYHDPTTLSTNLQQINDFIQTNYDNR